MAMLEQNEVHLWSVMLPLVMKVDLEDYLYYLSEDEKEKAIRYIPYQAKVRYICARYMLRAILSKYILQEARSIQFAYSPYGKPYICNSGVTDVHFNLSHSNRCIVYAIARAIPVGIDVEFLRSIDVEAIAKTSFSPYEYLQLMDTAPEDREKKFYSLWTCKEAFVKNRGKGMIAYPFSDFDVCLEKKAKIVSIRGDNKVSENYEVCIFSPNDAYIAALVVQQPVKSISMFFNAPICNPNFVGCW